MLLPVHPATTLTKTPPFPPRAPSVVAGDAQATVSWVAPITVGGSPITAYHVVPYHGSTVLPATTVTTTTATVKNLTDGQTYTFKVVGTNAIGNSPVSVATQAVTIGAPTVPRSVVAFPGQHDSDSPLQRAGLDERGTDHGVSGHAPHGPHGPAVDQLPGERVGRDRDGTHERPRLRVHGRRAQRSWRKLLGECIDHAWVAERTNGSDRDGRADERHRDGALDIASQHERESRE